MVTGEYYAPHWEHAYGVGFDCQKLFRTPGAAHHPDLSFGEGIAADFVGQILYQSIEQESLQMSVRRIFKVLAISIMLGSACNPSPSPSKTVEVACRTVERGDIEKAQSYFSSGLVSRRGIGPLKTDLTNVALELKQHGGIKSIRVLKEDVVGDVAEVSIEVTRGNGFVASANYKLIKEKGEWKIDEVTPGAGRVHNQ